MGTVTLFHTDEKDGLCPHSLHSVASYFSGRNFHLTRTCLENNDQLVFSYAER